MAKITIVYEDDDGLKITTSKEFIGPGEGNPLFAAVNADQACRRAFADVEKALVEVYGDIRQVREERDIRRNAIVGGV